MSQLNAAGYRRSQRLWRPGDLELQHENTSTTMNNDNNAPSAETPRNPTPTLPMNQNNANEINNATNPTTALDYDQQADDNYSEYEDNYYDYDVDQGWNLNLYPEANTPYTQQSTTYANQTTETENLHLLHFHLIIIIK